MPELLADIPIDVEQLADGCYSPHPRGRLPSPRDRLKFHVTDLIESAFQISRGNVGYFTYSGPPSGIMSLGRVWEAVADRWLWSFAEGRQGYYMTDVGLEDDGIAASLDGVMYIPTLSVPTTPVPVAPFVVEIKLRFSVNSEIPLRHWQQVRAYCHLLNTDVVGFCTLSVSSQPPTAIASFRVFRNSRESIVETWDMLVKTKQYLESAGHYPGR